MRGGGNEKLSEDGGFGGGSSSEGVREAFSALKLNTWWDQSRTNCSSHVSTYPEMPGTKPYLILNILVGRVGRGE